MNLMMNLAILQKINEATVSFWGLVMLLNWQEETVIFIVNTIR